jgi:hypothetical protein
VLTLTTGDAARTVTLSGNPTLADWFDQSVKAAANPTFASMVLSGGLTAGSGSVGIVNSAGKVPAISSTYFASLSGANLTALPASQLTGTLSSTIQQNISQTSSEVQVGAGHHIHGGTTTLGAGETVTLGAYTGLIIITRGPDDYTAMFIARGNGTQISEISDPGTAFSTTMGGASFNIYWTGGGLELQNNTGGTESFYYTVIAAP